MYSVYCKHQFTCCWTILGATSRYVLTHTDTHTCLTHVWPRA